MPLHSASDVKSDEEIYSPLSDEMKKVVSIDEGDLPSPNNDLRKELDRMIAIYESGIVDEAIRTSSSIVGTALSLMGYPVHGAWVAIVGLWVAWTRQLRGVKNDTSTDDQRRST